MNEQCHSLFQGIINKMAKDLGKYDPKDPEEQERFKRYPDGFISAKEMETEEQTNYKRQ